MKPWRRSRRSHHRAGDLSASVRPFGEKLKAPHVAHHDALAAASDQADFLTGAEGAARRMQRRPDHFREVLTREREIDQQAVVGFAARLVGELQEDTDDAL